MLALPWPRSISLGLEKMSKYGIDDPIPMALNKTSSVVVGSSNLTGIGEDIWCWRRRLQTALVAGQKLLSNFRWLLPLPHPSYPTTTPSITTPLHRTIIALASGPWASLSCRCYHPRNLHSTRSTNTMKLPSSKELGSVRYHQQRLHGTGLAPSAVRTLAVH